MGEHIEMSRERFPHPALFGVLVLPFGAAVGFLQIAVPFWLSRQGVPLAEIAVIAGIGFMPHAWKILWVPLIDIGPHRKVWYLVCTTATAALLAAVSMLPDPTHHRTVFIILITAAQATAATSSAALDALMATTSREQDKGRAGGFYMAGNVGGTGVLGALAIWLTGHLSATAAGLILAGIVLASSAGALTLHERAEGKPSSAVRLGRALIDRLVAIARDLWITVKSREGLTGLIICAAPVGCGALTNLFSAMAGDYHAPEEMVGLVNGLGGGIVGALGSVAGGYLADKMSRRVAYGAAGGFTALAALAMAMGPMTPVTYAWGTLTYSFASGIAFAAFAGMVLELVSHGAAVTTKYTLFVAISNQAISYTTLLDGKASEWFSRWGVRSTIAFDGLFTFVGIAVLVAMVMVGRKPPVNVASDAVTAG